VAHGVDRTLKEHFLMPDDVKYVKHDWAKEDRVKEDRVKEDG